MIRLNFNRQIFLWTLVFLLSGGGHAVGEISLPSAVKLDKSIHFQKPEGGTVEIKPGIYEIAQNGEKQLNLDPVGDEGPIAVQAIPAGHDQKVENPTAKWVPSPDNNPDVQHLVLWLPDGLALEAVGSFSGVFTRSTELWAKQAGSSDATKDDPLTIVFEEPIHFKTLGGDPKVVQPGEYQLGLREGGIQLSPAKGKGEPVVVATESMGTSAAVLLPAFDANADLEALIIATATGQSFVAVGSHSGAFPRGLFSAIKKVGGAVQGVAKAGAKVGYQVGKGAVLSTPAGAVIQAAGVDKYAEKYGKQIAGRAFSMGKGVATRTCGPLGAVGNCVRVIGGVAAGAVR